LALLAVPLGLLVLWAVLAGRKPEKVVKVPVVPVSVAAVSVRDWPVSLSALGAALPWQGVTIRAQVNGVLKRVAFQEGTFVQKGALLAEIDSAPYRAALMQAKGALQRDAAVLEEARLDLKRYRALAAQDSIAQQQVDAQAALVKQDEGTVRLDQGAVAAAQVNVDFCRITSPVAGRVGVRLVDPGNVVSTTDATGLVIVNQITPIAVTFNVPEGDFQHLVEASDSFTQPLQTRAYSQENGEALGVGVLSIADNHVDQTTGTVQMKARFPNLDRRLWPSQFVNVRLTLKTLPRALLMPSAAVNQGPSGAFAYVVGPGETVSVRPLKVSFVQDGMAVITSGVRPGELVVTDGQMLLKPGARVAIHQTPPSSRPAA
jgi:multidrug efflux system membrane fusion protein